MTVPLQQLSQSYPVWFCDIWGVLHNGVSPFGKTVDALERHRKNGGTVILVTNSPRTSLGVMQQLDEIGVARQAYDGLATSGDVTRTLMEQQGGQKIYHLGPERDLSIFAGLALRRVALAEADFVVCTGLRDEFHERPGDYRREFDAMLARGLIMISANPDKIVRKGDQLIYCAGALAEVYESLGGGVLMAGKPHPPIYDLAMARAGLNPSDKEKVLAIGDGPETDILGAARYGLDCILITGGINAGSDVEAAVRLQVPGARIILAVPELDWHFTSL